MARVTRDPHIDQYRDAIRKVVSRTHMRMPDSVDLLHLGELLAQVWQEGQDAGVSNYVRRVQWDQGPGDNKIVNPYLPPPK